MGNKNMQAAKRNKNDEFYTQLVDIENEMRHYRKHFKGKIIYMNADDPEESNFWKFFYLNFDFLELKKIISTHFDYEEKTYKLEYDGDEVIKTDLKENGDFRSNESIELLKEADIVITNPPFSLFREYVAQLVEYKKDFIVIGNFNAIAYKEIFPLIKDDKMWTGMSPRSMEFMTPEGELKAVNAVWFTNLDIPRRHERSRLWRKYEDDPSYYSKYDNYDAIEVSKVVDIPIDYDGVMGVPITYLGKHNPNEFDILGINTSISDKLNDDIIKPTKKYIGARQISKTGKETGGNKINDSSAILINKRPNKTYYLVKGIDGYLTITYARIFIKKKEGFELI